MDSETLERIKKDMEANRFSEAALTVISLNEGLDLVAEVERLRLVFAFHCQTGTLSLAQTATALNMSQTEVIELMRKLPKYEG